MNDHSFITKSQSITPAVCGVMHRAAGTSLVCGVGELNILSVNKSVTTLDFVLNSVQFTITQIFYSVQSHKYSSVHVCYNSYKGNFFYLYIYSITFLSSSYLP